MNCEVRGEAGLGEGMSLTVRNVLRNKLILFNVPHRLSGLISFNPHYLFDVDIIIISHFIEEELKCGDF